MPTELYESAVSVCSRCRRRVDGEIVFSGGEVLLRKRCPEHGAESVLLADDIPYYRLCRETFLKPPTAPLRKNTAAGRGCPHDCGLCPEHEQHSCLTIVEIGTRCELECPVCYAGSGPSASGFRTLEQIETMLDAVVRNEGEPDVVQISGGEPTLHPDFFSVLDMARSRPIKHLMVNTNGIRLSKDEEFASRLAEYMPRLEVYLQFDSLRAEALRTLRGADLREVRRKALERLDRLGISTTLVVTVVRGVNDGECGEIIDFALGQPCVRGVVFQTLQAAGRLQGFDPLSRRMTLTEVRRRVLAQSAVFRPEDIIPVPCHPESLAMAYALKSGGKVVPLTSRIDPQVLIRAGKNTITYERDVSLLKLLSVGHSPGSAAEKLRECLCLTSLTYKDVFRVLLVHFSDAYDLDVRSLKKCCVHIAHPDGRIIPFDTYNLFYRE